MHDPWHKLIPPLFGFFGSAVMMSYLGTMPLRMWATALASGPVMAYLATDTVLGYLGTILPWLPTGEEGVIKLSGLVGCAIGLASIHLVGAVATFGQRFAANPPSIKELK